MQRATLPRRGLGGPPIRQVFNVSRIQQNHIDTDVGTFHRDLTQMDTTGNAGFSYQERVNRYKAATRKFSFRFKNLLFRILPGSSSSENRARARREAAKRSGGVEQAFNYTEEQWRNMRRLKDLPDRETRRAMTEERMNTTASGRSSMFTAAANAMGPLERLRLFGQERSKGRATRMWLPNHRLLMRLFNLNPDPRSEWVPQSSGTENRVMAIAVGWMLGWAALGCFVLLPLFFGENQEQDLNTLKAVLEQEGVTEEQMIDTIEEMATLGADQEKALIERIRRERGFAPSAQ